MDKNVERLLTIRDTIATQVDTLLLGLKPFLTEENSDIKQIQVGALLLKKEVTGRLEESVIEKNLRSDTINDYLTKVRHDLRNPINTILGFSEMTLEDFQQKNQIENENSFSLFIKLTKQMLNQINEIKIPQKQPQIEQQHPVIKELETSSEDVEYKQFKESFSILIVDDIDTNCQLLDKYLKAIGYKNTQIVHDGFQALAKKNRFDLMLLDIDMPGMTGIQVLKRLKDDILQRQIMVLMISASDQVENVIECIQLGAEDFLPKPFDKDLLRVRIDSCVEKKWFIHKESIFREHLQFERERYETLLHALFPPVIVQELTETGKVEASYYDHVAVIFADLVGFTPFCDTHEVSEVIKNLQKYAELCEIEANNNGVLKIKTIGDSFLGVSGLITKCENPVLNCVHFALGLIAGIENLPSKWRLHMGIHYGHVIGGIVGHRQYLFDVWGDTVNTASRIQSLAEPNAIYLSKDAWELIKDQYAGHSLGERTIKGKAPLEIFVFDGKK